MRQYQLWQLIRPACSEQRSEHPRWHNQQVPSDHCWSPQQSTVSWWMCAEVCAAAEPFCPAPRPAPVWSLGSQHGQQGPWPAALHQIVPQPRAVAEVSWESPDLDVQQNFREFKYLKRKWPCNSPLIRWLIFHFFPSLIRSLSIAEILFKIVHLFTITLKAMRVL